MNPTDPWIRFDTDVVHHLRRLDDGSYESIGNDPAFNCRLPATGLSAGWYEVEIAMERISGPALWPFLYPNYGDNLTETHKVFLPFVEDGASVHRGIALLTNPPISLRFDPSVAVGRFTFGGIRVRRVGRREAALSMLRSLATRPMALGRRLRAFAALAGGLLREGLTGFAGALEREYARPPAGGERIPYSDWLAVYDSPQQRAGVVSRLEALAGERPLFSIVMPVYNTPEKWLRKCIDSVLAQSYGRWELCIANDASPAPYVRRILDEYARSDPRVRVVHRERNGHISAASNSAIELATGEWIALLDHDDELHPNALAEVALALVDNPRWRLVFSDEDKIDGDGNRFDPYMKPDWNYDLFLSHNCISHLGVYEASLLREIGGFRVGFEGSQDWDLALRCIERLDADQIGHVPQVLYHWRAIQGSTALAPQEKDYAHDAGMRAIGEHLRRIGSGGRVVDIPGLRGNYRVRYPVPSPAPLVSIIVPTRDRVELLRACIESVLRTTTYPAYEILVVDNQSREADTLAYFRTLAGDDRVRVIAYDAPFNYSRINNFAATEARGDLLCLLNNDITVITPGWLEEMVAHATRPGVGAVGAMLYYPNDTIQHAGVVVGAHGVAAHAYAGDIRGCVGHMSRARLTQEMSAVTAACLVVRRDAYEAVDGLDPHLDVAFNDVDFCLRLRAAGYRNVWTPFAELYHHESATRGYETSPEKMARFNGELVYMQNKWGAVLEHDPAYSRNHSVNDALHTLAFPPRDHVPADVGALGLRRRAIGGTASAATSIRSDLHPQAHSR